LVLADSSVFRNSFRASGHILDSLFLNPILILAAKIGVVFGDIARVM